MKKESSFNYDYIKQVTEIPRLVILSLRKKKSPPEAKSILVINTCLIGDIAASLSALRQFIKKHPHAKIDVIVPSPTKSVVEKVRGVNKVYTAKSVTNRKIEKIASKKELDEILKKEYDLVLVIRISKDAYHLLKKVKHHSINVSPASYIKYLLHLLGSVIKKGNVKQYSQINFEWFGEDVKYLSFKEIFKFSREDYQKVKNMPAMSGEKKKILIHAGSGWRKDWSNEKWAKVIKRINKLGNFKFIFIGSGEDEERSFRIIQRRLNFKVYSIIGQINLAELLLIMRMSNYFIGIDSGPRNLAHLTDLRSVGLLGPGPKHFMPPNKKDIIISKLSCRSERLQLFCFKKERSIDKISVNDVYNGFNELLN